jgi:hypothetical protein
MADAKQQLVEFLDRKVFDPVLHASERGKGDADKRRLEHLKDRTRSEQDRYHHYEDAAKVKQMFQDDLRSEPARRIHRESHQLGLPALPDVQDEFDQLCARLGV